MREFFRRSGYLEVDTPLLVRSPGVEPHLRPFRVPVGGSQPSRWLNTSPEYHMKRLLAAGSGPIFQLAHAFRAGEYGDRHNPEFTMLEWYRPGARHLDLLDDVIGLLRAAAPADGRLSWGGHTVDLSKPPEVLSVRDAFRRWARVDVDTLTGPDRLAHFSRHLVDDIEPHLSTGDDAQVFALTDYPADMASLARLSPDDATVAERLEVYVCGIELANAFTELTDPVEQRERMQSEAEQRAAEGLDELPVDERFLSSLHAMPPAAGIALGFDRLVMLLAGTADMRDVLAFPWEDA